MQKLSDRVRCDNCAKAKGVFHIDVFGSPPHENGYCNAPEDKRHVQVEYFDCSYFEEENPGAF